MEIQEYGVCRLSVIPVRKGPTHTSEQVTQLLFGDDYRIIGSNQDVTWFQIEVTADRYQGWIDVKQHHPISQEYFDYLRHAEFKITTDVTSSILYNKSPFMILLGSIIPISSSELFKMEEQFAFNGDSKNLGQKRGFDFLQTVARKYLYAPYQWGGKTPFGIDCSGLLPGDVISTGTPSGVGMGLKPPSYLKPGDVVELGIESLGTQRQEVRAWSR